METQKLLSVSQAKVGMKIAMAKKVAVVGVLLSICVTPLAKASFGQMSQDLGQFSRAFGGASDLTGAADYFGGGYGGAGCFIQTIAGNAEGAPDVLASSELVWNMSTLCKILIAPLMILAVYIGSRRIVHSQA